LREREMMQDIIGARVVVDEEVHMRMRKEGMISDKMGIG